MKTQFYYELYILVVYVYSVEFKSTSKDDTKVSKITSEDTEESNRTHKKGKTVLINETYVDYVKFIGYYSSKF